MRPLKKSGTYDRSETDERNQCPHSPHPLSASNYKKWIKTELGAHK
jgi:hypothetical protein